MKSDKVIITAILCITFLAWVALTQGINGLLLTAVFAAIGGLAGYMIPSPKDRVKGGESNG